MFTPPRVDLRSILHALPVILFSVALFSPSGAPKIVEAADHAEASQPSAHPSKDALKIIWNSIDSLRFRCDEADVDKSGAPSIAGRTRFTFIVASGGRRAFEVTAVRPSGEELIDNMREDGRRRYWVQSAKGEPKKVQRIQITNQTDTDMVYTNVMCTPLSIVMPFGKPLYTHLDAGGVIEWKDVAGVGERPIIRFKGKTGPVTCQLDPDHDWIPQRVVVEPVSETIVTGFTQSKGHWFPSEGFTQYSGATQRRTTFKVTDLIINGPVEPTDFNPMSSASKGTFVIDKTTGKSYVVGGLSTLPKNQPKSIRRERSATAISARAEPSRIPWEVLIACFSALALAIAFVLWRSRR